VSTHKSVIYMYIDTAELAIFSFQILTYIVFQN